MLKIRIFCVFRTELLIPITTFITVKKIPLTELKKLNLTVIKTI